LRRFGFGAFRLERQACDELSLAGAYLRHQHVEQTRLAHSGRARVAELADAGMSNRLIAQALFVTVSRQVAPP